MKLLEGGWPAGVAPAPTLPGAYYASPAIFERELESIWFDTWLIAGRVEQIPREGDFFTRRVGDESVIIVRSRGGGVSAFYNVCRHRGSRLCPEAAGNFKGGVIRCPYHSWTYETARGALVAAPNIPDDIGGFDRAEFPLHALRVEAWEGFIWINFNPDAPALAESLGLPATYAFYERYHLGALRTGEMMSYDVHANWKIVMENGLECLHCSHIHPELSRCTPPLLPRRWLDADLPESKVFKHSGGMEVAPGFQAVNLDGRPRRPRFPDLTEQDGRTIYYAFLYPQMLLGFAPDYVFFFTVWPEGLRRSKVWGYWLFDPEVMARADFDRSDAVEFWDVTNREDWAACEQAQLGSESRAYRQGGVLVQNEWRVDKFRRYVLDLVPPL
jgi:glycine betaine catabolism A